MNLYQFRMNTLLLRYKDQYMTAVWDKFTFYPYTWCDIK